MRKMRNQDAHQAAINLIDEQLRALPVSIAMIAHPSAAHSTPEVLHSLAQLQSKRRNRVTGSAGNIVASSAAPHPALNLAAANDALLTDPLQQNIYLRTIIGNALLAVGMFMKEHGMAAMRTPEIQFLDHVCDAILNANRFSLAASYMPIASFDGLRIDGSLDGSYLFGDGTHAGLLEFGDALDLLHWLSLYLRGERNFVSGGDAG